MHLLSASIWVGGLFVLVTILVPTVRSLAPPKRRMVLSMALPRFSVIALIAWATLALTGLYSAWLHVGSFDGLLHTDYGKALLTKLAILVPILGLAAFNLFAVTSRLHAATGNPERVGSWTRRFSYTIACEAVLAIAVLAVVGTLTAEAPARETLASAPAGMEIALTGGERDAELTISPGNPGPNRFDLEVSGEPMLHETEVLLRVKSTGQDTGEKDLRFIHGGGSTYTYEGSELSLAGKWDMQLIVRQPDAPEWRAFATVDIETAKPAASPTAPWVLGNVGGIAGSLLALAGVALLMIAWHEPGIRRRMPLAAAGAVIIAIAVIVLVFAKTAATGDIAQLAARIA
jgi:copper transport protein